VSPSGVSHANGREVAAGPTLLGLAQFAGAHTRVATAAFDAGIVVGVGIALAIAHFALLLALVFGRTVGVIIRPALLGLLAWQWTAEANHELFHEIGPRDRRRTEAGADDPALDVARHRRRRAGFALPRGFSGQRAASLRDALLARLKRERALRG